MISTNPSRNEIWLELEESTFRNGGVDTNALKEMWNYIFGSGSYDRDSFAGYGKPEVSNLTLDGNDSEIQCTFDLDVTGQFSCTFVAEYWESSQSLPYNTSYQEIGSASTTGTKTGQITGLSNGTEYNVRVTAYNKFNNTGNYPEAPSSDANWDWTNTATATPEQPQYTTPQLNNWATVFGGNMETDWNYDSVPSTFIAEMRINGANEETANVVSSNNWGTSTNPKEATWSHPTINPQIGDEVEVRIRAGDNSDPQQSEWSQWYSDTV